MNGTGKSPSIGAVAVPRYELIDKDGKVKRGKFGSAEQAVYWAKCYWPDQEQDEDRAGRGWDVQVVGCDLSATSRGA